MPVKQNLLLNGRLISFVVICLVVLMLQSCAQPEGATGSSVGWKLSGNLVSDTFQVDRDTTFLVPRISTGGSEHIYVGKALSMESRGLVAFPPHILKDRWQYNWGKAPMIRLHYDGGFGERSQIKISVEQFQQKWDTADPPPYDSLQNRNHISNLIEDSESGTHYIDITIPVERIQRWLAYTDSIRSDTMRVDTANVDTSFSILLDFDDSMDWMVRFRSRLIAAESLKPSLFIYVMKPDTADTNVFHPDSIAIFADKSVWLPNDLSEIPDDRLVIGSGAVYEINMRFDLSRLWERPNPKPIIINRALLVMYFDLEKFPEMPMTSGIMPYKLTNDSWLIDPLNAPESGFALLPTAIDTSLGRFELVVTSPASDWVLGPDSNFGVALHSSGEGFNIDRIYFHTKEDPNPELRPRLELHYTEMP